MVKYLVVDKDEKIIKEFTNDFEAALYTTKHMDNRYTILCNSKDKCREWILFKYRENI